MSNPSFAEPIDPRLDQALHQIGTEISECSRVIGRCFLETNVALERQREARNAALGAGQVDGQGGVPLIDACAGVFGTLVEHISTSEGDLRSAEGELRQVHDRLTSLSKVAVQSHILALQAAVEGACLNGEAARDFTLAAENIRRLATLISELIRQVDEMVSSLSAKLLQFYRVVSHTREQLVEKQHECIELASSFSQTLVSAEAHARHTFADILAIAESMEKRKNAATTALQFEDLSLQLIEQIRMRAKVGELATVAVTQSSMEGGDFELF